MKVLINITEIWCKLVEVEVPGGMDTETGVEWARNKVEQDYYDGKIDMTVDIDGRTDFDVLDPGSVCCGSTNPWDEKPRPEPSDDEKYAETIKQLEEEADNKYN